MLPFKRPAVTTLLAVCLLTLAGCSNSPLGGILQRSLEADPRLTGSSPSPTTNPVSTQPSIAQLPADFPSAIPRYPNSELEEVVPSSGDTASQTTVATRWATSDNREQVLAFYRQQLPANGWQIETSPGTEAEAIVARQNTLQVTITVPPTAQTSTTPTPATPDSNNSSTNNPSTEFVIQYLRSGQVGQVTPSPQASGDLSKLTPFSDSTSVGISGNSGISQPQTVTGDVAFTDLNKTPKELQQFVNDVAKLGILAPTSNSKNVSAKTLFEPNKAITRREYARWLVAANNRLYANRSAQQIRLATNSSQSAFQDVPRTDSDFAAIQGLAEAGIIPSPLSGDSTTVTFRPDAPLTREILLLWKVPIDTRQALPTATIDAIKQTWGFQDAARIDPKAQRAVLADFQNSDLANIRRAFGYTTLFQPKKSVTRAEAAATLWYIGFQGEGQSAQDALKASQSGSQSSSQSGSLSGSQSTNQPPANP